MAAAATTNESESAVPAAKAPPWPTTRTPHADVAEITPSLPLETRWPPFLLRLYGGFWLPESVLPGVAAVHASGGFAVRPTDVLLASFPKSGTTWLKALAFAAVHRARHPPSAADHPLRHRNPQDLVEFIELASLDALEEALPSTRVLSTHLPYSLLPESVVAEADEGGGGSGCRIVYVCRDPKDTLVSFWFFAKKMAAAMGVTSPSSFTLDEAFELFCDGRCADGPQWSHVLGYWEASRRTPETKKKKVLFLRYEEMLLQPASSLKTMAEFMGCAFSPEEEESGVVDAIVELCSHDTLKSLEVNKNGTWESLGVKNELLFRKGVAGDWRGHLTLAMAARLDKIVEDATRGSGLTFGAD